VVSAESKSKIAAVEPKIADETIENVDDDEAITEIYSGQEDHPPLATDEEIAVVENSTDDQAKENK
jgi:hypothetical protein